MCYTGNPTVISGKVPIMADGCAFPMQCGCGCLGKEQTAVMLDRYREHLKAELKHIETRISQLGKDGQ